MSSIPHFTDAPGPDPPENIVASAYVARRNQGGGVTAWAQSVPFKDPSGEERYTTWPLDPRLDLISHSPNGFELGYAGSGPAQLALAILADALKDDQLAIRLHQRFKFDFIASANKNHFEVFREDVLDWAAEQFAKDSLHEAKS